MDFSFHFLPPNINRADALHITYDYGLVIISYVIAVMASYSGLLMSERVSSVKSAFGRFCWLCAGALVMGIGIWAMHFTGMLAAVFPIPISYDPLLTVVSAVPAILASALAIYVLSRDGYQLRRNLVGGTLFGLGIGIMHFMGMSAMRMHAMHYYDGGLFALSIAVAIILGVVSLYANDLKRDLGYSTGGKVQIFVAAGLMGLAIAGMHYTGMTATYIFRGSNMDMGSVGITLDRFWLSIGVAGIAITLTLIATVAAVFDRRLQMAAYHARVDRKRMIEAIEGVKDGFALFDENEELVLSNDAFRRTDPMLRHFVENGGSYRDALTAWAALRNNYPSGVSEDDYIAGCIRRFKDGSAAGEPEEIQLKNGRWVYSRQISLKSGGLVELSTDITDLKKLQAVYEEQATLDALTGLASKRLFEDRLGHAISLSARSGLSLKLLFIDVDKFKAINDTMGHDVGDFVLREVAFRIKRAARETDTVARLGGDEFGILLDSHGAQAEAENLASRVIRTVIQPIFPPGQEAVYVGASVGIAILPANRVSKLALVKAADRAMYRAKMAGGNVYRIHNEDTVLQAVALAV